MRLLEKSIILHIGVLLGIGLSMMVASNDTEKEKTPPELLELMDETKARYCTEAFWKGRESK